MKKYYPEISLVFVNLLSLLGIIFLKWELFDIVFLYWLESLVIVFFNALKMRKVVMMREGELSPNYFVYGYIYFMMAGFWLFFILVFFGPLKMMYVEMPGKSLGWTVIFVLLALIISHGISFKNNFIANKEYNNLTISELFYAPVHRFSIIQLVVFFTGIGFLITDSTFYGAIILVILKTGLDLFAHLQEHKSRKNLINRYTNEQINKIHKRKRIIGYFLIFAPFLMLPLFYLTDPESNTFIKAGTLLFTVSNIITNGIAFFFIFGVLVLVPIGGIILSNNIKNR